jgi:uncharacterized repeat protein (TIGR03803 family)
MIGIRAVSSKSILVAGLVLGIAVPMGSAQAAKFHLLYAFQDGDAASPFGAMTDGNKGRYGATYYGGANNLGAVFRLRGKGKEQVLHSFSGVSDGGNPQTDLIADAAGNLYGTASAGGSANCGTVFKMKPNGRTTVLYTFQCRPDGFTPNGGLVLDSAANLYGTTYGGGAPNMGTVFKLAADGTETIAYAFQGGSDAAYPNSGLIIDKKGNLFGTTYGGGTAGFGTVYELSAKGKETILYSFKGGSDGANPFASLSADAAGNLYGTTWGGGGNGCNGNGCGTVFRVAPDGTETVLHSFEGGSDGFGPYAGVTVDASGNLYGSTLYGGGSGCSGNGCGLVFKLAADGTKTDLHDFIGDDGSRPSANFLADETGNLYGTTFDGGGSGCGGGGCGVVFKIKE